MNLLEHLTRYQPFTAVVVGDFMLDEQLFGAAERLSPDAPVPVLQATRAERTPGGAANVARCLRALEADVRCFGVVGDDESGRHLRELLRSEGIDVDGVVTDASRPTTIKRSLIGLAQHRHPQKMFRVDHESTDPLPGDVAQAIERALLAAIADADIVCIEDYRKGVCGEVLCQAAIRAGRAAGVPVLVDPAAIEDYAKYRGATLATPNRSEVELVTGARTPDDPDAMRTSGIAEALVDRFDLEAIVITLDRHGALLQVRGEAPELISTLARSVYDVTGAGDMVLAALAGALANDFGWLDAVRFANAAAGLEVEVFGVQPIPFAAVRREALARMRGLEGKVRTLDELTIELAVHREQQRRIVLTNGCFDVIHAGHVAYLREARDAGDVLVVGINADAEVARQKGPGRPIFPIDERVEILAAIEPVDYVVVFEEPTADALIDAVRPDLYVKGGDYRPEEINEYATLRAHDIDIRVLTHRQGRSSTDVIARMLETQQEIG